MGPELWPLPAPATPCSTVMCSAHTIKKKIRGSRGYLRHPPSAGRYRVSLILVPFHSMSWKPTGLPAYIVSSTECLRIGSWIRHWHLPPSRPAEQCRVQPGPSASGERGGKSIVGNGREQGSCNRNIGTGNLREAGETGRRRNLSRKRTFVSDTSKNKIPSCSKYWQHCWLGPPLSSALLRIIFKNVFMILCFWVLSCKKKDTCQQGTTEQPQVIHGTLFSLGGGIRKLTALLQYK